MPLYRRKLGRDWAQRLSLLKTMTTQLLQHERIRTTLAKARELKRYADKTITLAKRDTPAAREKIANIVRTDRELHKLCTTIVNRYHHRDGGYTRLLHAGIRQHDGAKLAFVELVDRQGELRPARPATGTRQFSFIPANAQPCLRD